MFRFVVNTSRLQVVSRGTTQWNVVDARFSDLSWCAYQRTSRCSAVNMRTYGLKRSFDSSRDDPKTTEDFEDSDRDAELSDTECAILVTPFVVPNLTRSTKVKTPHDREMKPRVKYMV